MNLLLTNNSLLSPTQYWNYNKLVYKEQEKSIFVGLSQDVC